MKLVGGIELVMLILFLLLGALIIGAGAVWFFWGRSKAKALPNTGLPASSPRPQSDPQPTKRCSQCNSTYTDLTLRFCLIDGAALVDVGVYQPASGAPSHEPPPTVRYDSDYKPR